MPHNTGIPYELIAREIFELLMNQDSAQNIEVKHNVPLKGKVTEHQIDVYWEFELGGVTYRSVVQTKDWNTPLNKGELLKFKAVLDDLPGQPTGIVVTRSGYQKGAKEVASANGILLYELVEERRPPIVVTEGSIGRVWIARKTSSGLKDLRDPQWMREPGTLVMQTIIFDPSFELRFEYDQAWLANQREHCSNEVLHRIASESFTARPRDINLYDGSGNTIGNVQDILTEFVQKEIGPKATVNEHKVKVFQLATFRKTSSEALPFIKISALTARVTLTEREPYETPLRLAGIVRFILRNLTEGTEQFFDVKHDPKKDA
jgi:restriction endonuclease